MKNSAQPPVRTMKPAAVVLILLFVEIALAPHAKAQAAYQNKDYRSVADGNWNAITTWETNVTVAGGWVPATVAGNNLNPGGVIEITNARTVTISSTGSGTRLVVEPGGTLAISSAFTVSNSVTKASYTNGLGAVDSADLIVAGTNNISGSQLTIGANATAIVESNAVVIVGTGANSTPIVATGTIDFKSGSRLTSSKTGGTTYPNATWDSGSVFEIASSASINNPILASTSYGTVRFSSPAQSSSRTLASAITGIENDFIVADFGGQVLQDFPGSLTVGVAGNVAVTNATLSLAAGSTVPGVLNVTGNVYVASSAKLDVSTSSAGKVEINFVGGGSHTLCQAGIISTATKYAWTVAAGNALTLSGSNVTINTGTTDIGTFTNNGVLDLGTNAILGSGQFIAGAGSTTRLAAAEGFSVSGNIRTLAVTNIIDPAASFEFYGSAAQLTGINFPATIGGLKVNNNSGLALSAGVTVNGNLSGTGTITSGTVTASATGGVAPGNGPGTLTVHNLVLDAASTSTFELTNSTTAGGGTNDLLIVTGTLTPASSTIAVSNYGPDSLDIGDYTLVDYSAGNESGATFNPTPLWSGALTNTPGTTAFIFDDTTNKKIILRVTDAGSSPIIGSATLSGSGLILSGSGGIANDGFTVLTSTNLTLPLASWSVDGTGTFDDSGNFSYTNSSGITNPAVFFIIRNP